MRFFNANKVKEIMHVAAAGSAVCSIPVVAYLEIQQEKKTAEEFQKKYPNAHVYFKPRVIAGMAGASYVIAEDKETGKIIAQR